MCPWGSTRSALQPNQVLIQELSKVIRRQRGRRVWYDPFGSWLVYQPGLNEEPCSLLSSFVFLLLDVVALGHYDSSELRREVGHHQELDLTIKAWSDELTHVTTYHCPWQRNFVRAGVRYPAVARLAGLTRLAF